MASERKISLIGAGRMGGKVVKALSENPFGGMADIIAVYDSDPQKIGKSLNELYGYGGDLIVSDISSNFLRCAGVLDFSNGSAVQENLPRVVEQMRPTAVIIGATGILSTFDARLAELAKKTRIARSNNWSEEVCYFLNKTVPDAASKFPISEGWQVDVTDAHHNQKGDGYSGTALTIAEITAGVNGLGKDDIVVQIPYKSSTLYVPYRELEKDFSSQELQKYKSKRPLNKIVLHTGTRAGNIIGYHRVDFYKGDLHEKIENDVPDRILFARGALKALFIMLGCFDEYPPGSVFEPKDIFDLE